MSLEEKSLECLLAAREALERRDFKVANKQATMSISFNPSIEGYYLKAEAYYLAGEFSEARGSVEQARALCLTEADEEAWTERLEQCYVRASDADSEDEGPPVSEIISVMVPILLKDKGKAWMKIGNNPDLSTNGLTLLRIGNSVIYDVEFIDFNPEWVDVILQNATDPLEPKVIKAVRKTANFLHVFGPNVAVHQNISSQVDLAIQFVQLLEPLVRSLEAPVAFLRGSNNVVDYDKIRKVCDDITPENLIGFYVKLMNAGESLFSVGMHQFGFADVEIPYSLVPFDDAFDLISEFLLFQLVNNFSEPLDMVEFESQSVVYTLKRLPEERFDIEGESRHNEIGVWHFVSMVDE